MEGVLNDEKRGNRLVVGSIGSIKPGAIGSALTAECSSFPGRHR